MIESVTLTQKPAVRPLGRPDLTLHELDGEALIYDPTSAGTHRLNPTALFIWRKCDGTRDAAVIAEELAEVYDVPPDAALEHVEQMLHEFAKNNLVMTADGPSH